MKNKMFGITLMAIGLAVGGWLALYIFATKGLSVLFGAVIPYFAGKIIYKAGGPSEGVIKDAITGIKAGFKKGESVAAGVKEALHKS